MKRLLIDVNSLVPYYLNGKMTGIGRTTLELVQALGKLKNPPFEITLYSQNMKGIGAKNTRLPFKYCHFYYPNREKYNKLLAKTSLKEWCTGYDLMHIPHNFDYLHRPERCLITLHDALFMKMQEEAFGHDKMKRLVPPLMHQCAHIATCSVSSKRDIIETMGIDPEKIDVIYWGIKHDIFHPLPKEEVSAYLQSQKLEHPYFLGVSCNAERKRTHILVRCFLDFCKHQQAVHDLVLVWQTPPNELMEEIKKHPYGERIHFISLVSDEELAKLYNGASALFFPSAYEGFGLPILEAMACGTPVFTCRNSSLNEIGGDAAHYLDEPIEISIPQVMAKWEKGFPDSRRRIEEGLMRAQMFSWEKTAEAYVSLYDKLLNP